MAKYYRHYWDTVDSPPDVQIGPLKGGKISKASRSYAVHNGLDKIPALGRRIVFQRSMSGANTWQSGTPPGTTPRQVGSTTFDLTPGCVLGMACLYLPSGNNTAGGAWGEVSASIVWTSRDGERVSTSHIIPLEGFGDGSFSDTPWGSLRTKRIAKVAPSSLVSITTARDWSLYTKVEITVFYNGNPRVVDLVIYERPLTIAREADDDPGTWVSGMFASGSPSGPVPNLTAPLQRMSETALDGNPRGGTWILMDQAKAQSDYLGPMLFHWTAYNEETIDATNPTDDYVDGGAWTSANWYRIPDATSASDPLTLISNKGWGLASGAYARPARVNNDVPMPNSGVVPVRFAVRVSSDTIGSTTPFTARLYSEEYSYVELSGTAPALVSSGEFGSVAFPEWFEVFGYLECGKGPGDEKSAVLVIQPDSGANGLRVYDAACYKAEKPRALELPSSGLVFHVDSANQKSYPGSGAVVTDISSTPGTGTLDPGATFSGGVFEFDGSTGVVHFPNNAARDDIFDGGGTVVAIFNLDSDGESSLAWITADRDADNQQNGWSLISRNESAGNVDIELVRQFSTTDGSWSTTVSLNAWHIVIFTYDDTNVANNPTVYVDGGSGATPTETLTPVGSANSGAGNDVAIGNVASLTDLSQTRTADGSIPVVMWYNREITASEAADIYAFYARRYGF